MADSKTSTESKSSKSKQEEPKAALPVGHPRAGYTEPDLSFHEGTGKIPDVEREWHEARNKQQQEDAERIADEEDKVAKEEQEEQQKAYERNREEEQKKLAQPAGGPAK